jgi:hypothetical protein
MLTYNALCGDLSVTIHVSDLPTVRPCGLFPIVDDSRSGILLGQYALSTYECSTVDGYPRSRQKFLTYISLYGNIAIWR